MEANTPTSSLPASLITSQAGRAAAARPALLFVSAGLIEQRVTDGPRGCCPISGLPRAQWVSPLCYWLKASVGKNAERVSHELGAREPGISSAVACVSYRSGKWL